MKTKINKVVNFDRQLNEVTMLDYTFIHSDNFKGAAGAKFDLVSKEKYKDRMRKENVIERLKDCFDIDSLPNYFESYNGLYNAMKRNNEIESFVFNTSYSEFWDQIRNELKLSKKDAYIFNFSGGGRCFDKDFQGNVNIELSKIIRQFETN